MKKTLARHMACGVADLSKLRCNGCEIDPIQLKHDCLLLDDILIHMPLEEAGRQSDVAPEQLDAIKSWLAYMLNVWYSPL